MRRKLTAAVLISVLLLSGCTAKQKESGDSESISSSVSSEAQTSETVKPENETSETEQVDFVDDEQPLVATGEYWEAKVGPGNYTIGVDIPVGVLDLYAENGSGRITSSDGMLAFDLESEYDEFSEEDYQLSEEEEAEAGDQEELSELAEQIKNANKAAQTAAIDKDEYTYSEMEELMASTMITGTMSEYRSVGFDPGVVISITGSLTVRIVAEDSDVSGMQSRSRVGEPVVLTSGSYTVGKDIEPGLYNISAKEGYGSIIADNGTICEYMANPAEPGINSEKYVNYTAAEGTVITIEGVTVSFQQYNM